MLRVLLRLALAVVVIAASAASAAPAFTDPYDTYRHRTLLGGSGDDGSDSSSADACAGVTSCPAIAGTACGWCWDTNTAEVGSASGPAQGTCNEWTWVSADCGGRHPQCEALPYCEAINGTDCGWCWDVEISNGQGQGMQGSVLGPRTGTCQQWTWSAAQCGAHYACTRLPDCLNILHTDCGWCTDGSGQALYGDASGPLVGTCSRSGWLWDATQCPVVVGPQQIHLAYGADPTTQMTVTWSTRTLASAADGGNTVTYWAVASADGDGDGEGDDDGAYDKHTATAVVRYFNDSVVNPNGCHYVLTATMEPLVPGTTYAYFVQSGAHASAEFSFRADRPPSAAFDPVFLVLGDMGRIGGAPSLHAIASEVATGTIASIVHVGDFAYDLDDDGGQNGDNFMNRLQSIAANYPYMTCPGNHEINNNFSHYRHRFAMPGYEQNDGFDMWFSWDSGRVHWISYSTEAVYARPQDMPRQLAWLRADLERANANRAERPWVVAFGHRPMYCSNDDGDDCTLFLGRTRAALEQVMYDGGVDVIIEAHEHSYERLWPVYNQTVTQHDYVEPRAPVHIITGAAGCNENAGYCINPITSPNGPWSAFRAAGTQAYGYGHLRAPNATHLYWDEYFVESDTIADAIWVVQHSHGPFAPPAHVKPAREALDGHVTVPADLPRHIPQPHRRRPPSRDRHTRNELRPSSPTPRLRVDHTKKKRRP